jgi:rod shape-determining protein MreC
MFADNRFGYLDRVRFGLGFVTAPVYWVADTPARISFWIDDVFVSRTDLIEENETLREQLLLSQRQLQLLESLASENSRLRALQSSSDAIPGEVLPAEIINVSPDPFSKRILVNKGARDGVFVGQALLDANGLMGQVEEVLPFTSWVLLITDSHHVTPVQVNRNGERALARGSRTTSSELDLEFVTQTQDIAAGDMLVSSGMGQVYPKDYPVANVTSVYIDPGQPYVRIKATPIAQIDSTRNVMLVFNDPEEEVSSRSQRGSVDPASQDNYQTTVEEMLTDDPVPTEDPAPTEVESQSTDTSNQVSNENPDDPTPPANEPDAIPR